MSKVITFATKFPSYHPRKGEPTFFVEKIFAGLADQISNWKMPNHFVQYDWYAYYNCREPKFHTIRAGNRWKEGDWFSPRIWSDKPYRSPQLTISQDIQIKKVYDVKIEMFGSSYCVSRPSERTGYDYMMCLGDVAQHDGLSIDDFEGWFNKLPFTGQLICWASNIKY